MAKTTIIETLTGHVRVVEAEGRLDGATNTLMMSTMALALFGDHGQIADLNHFTEKDHDDDDAEFVPVLTQTETAHNHVVVDLSGVSYLSRDAQRILVEYARKAKNSGKKIVLTGVDDIVREALELTGLDQYFEIYNTAEAAQAILYSHDLEVAEQNKVRLQFLVPDEETEGEYLVTNESNVPDPEALSKGAAIIQLADKIDSITSYRLEQALQILISANFLLIVVNLEQVTYISHAAISVLYKALQQQLDNGKDLLLANQANRKVADIMELLDKNQDFRYLDDPKFNTDELALAVTDVINK